MKGSFSLNLPKSVTVFDGTLREGIQNEETFIPTETKMFLLNGLIDAGLKYLEPGAISPADAMPQFIDTEEILKRIPRDKNIIWKCNTFTMKLVQRAVKLKQEGYGPDIINTQYATTDEFSRFFFRKSMPDRLKFIQEAIKVAHDAGLIIQVTNISPWCCPFTGEMPMEVTLETSLELVKCGADIVRYSDSFGDVTPDKVYEFFSRLLDKHPDPNKFTLHAHDYHGFGLAAYVAAMQAGCIRFDTTLGGIGGPPALIVGGIHSRGAVEYHSEGYKKGLPSTEDFAVLCDAMGIETGIDIEKVFILGRWMERILGRKLWSFCLGSGKIPKGSEIIKGREKGLA